VAADTAGKRKELQGNVMKTFYLKNVSTPTELQEAANTIRGMLDVTRVQLVPTQSAMMLRGTTAQMILAEKLLADIDKPKSEVVIDIAVMQISRNRLRTLGTNVPTSASVVMVPGVGAVGGAGSGGGSGGSGGTFTLNSLRNLTADNFQVSIPGASLTFLMSDSNTKLLQNPQIRALDNQKATLKIGDRVPISTGSFQSGLGGGVNTQFQYLDVGVNIDITPHIHSEGEVSLKMVLEISSVTGSQNIGGISQPIIGQRRIEHEARLKDGEVNLIGGILEDSESQSLSGYPWLARIPILKYLFGQESKDRRENEIVFSITPHVVRAQDLNEQNLRLVDVGTGSSVEVRRKNPQMTEAANTAPTRRPSGLSAPVSPSNQGVPTQSKDQKAVTGVALSPPVPAPVTQNPRAVSMTSRPNVSAPPVSAAPASRASAEPRAQASSDPCPYGQHLVEQESKVFVCAFD
jgi:general secretion pathway protein D